MAKTANITAKFSAKVPEEIMKECRNKKNYMKRPATGGTLYFFGLVGAAIYFISIATSFWVGVVGFLKALVRPIFLVYGLLRHIGM